MFIELSEIRGIDEVIGSWRGQRLVSRKVNAEVRNYP
jgi:hypothetical protein